MQYPNIAQPQYGFGPTMPPGMYDTPPAMMNFKEGGMISNAQKVQSQGRNDDTMLVHMTPREVGGLQALAMQHGGSLTINPKTGLPEAGFLDNFLPTLLGIGGAFLGIPPHLTAMAVGGIQTARTGDLGKGLLAGLGAYGGSSMASAFGAGAAPASVVGDVSSGLANPGAVDPSLVANQYSIAPPVGTTTQGLSASQLGATSQGLGSTFTTPTTAGFGPTTDLYSVSAPATGAGITPSASTMANFGTPSAQPSFIDRFAQGAAGPGGTPSALKTGLAATGVVAPFLQGPDYTVPGSTTEKSNYDGPYTPSERRVSYPDEERRRRSSEFTFFTPSNPVPFEKGGLVPMLENGGFVLTKKAVDGLGKGNNKKGQQVASAGLGAIPIRGKGTGTSDSIKTSIDGKRPARVSNGEAYVPKKQVAKHGGAKKFYDLMKKAEKRA